MLLSTLFSEKGDAFRTELVITEVIAFGTSLD